MNSPSLLVFYANYRYTFKRYAICVQLHLSGLTCFDKCCNVALERHVSDLINLICIVVFNVLQRNWPIIGEVCLWHVNFAVIFNIFD